MDVRDQRTCITTYLVALLMCALEVVDVIRVLRA